MGKILPISLKQNFTFNTLGCCGLTHSVYSDPAVDYTCLAGKIV